MKGEFFYRATQAKSNRESYRKVMFFDKYFKFVYPTKQIFDLPNYMYKQKQYKLFLIIYKDSFNNPVPTANDTWLFRRHFAEYVIGTISFIYFNFQKFNIHCIVRSIICFPISLLLTFVYFLGRSDFITGDTPTVADLLAASELEQPSIPIPL